MKGTKLAELMQEHELTITKLARSSGFAPGTIRNMLNGRHGNATEETYRRLALAFDTTADKLFQQLEGADQPQELEPAIAAV
jgi:transcriptional regulator with XRE-family HTH domain